MPYKIITNCSSCIFVYTLPCRLQYPIVYAINVTANMIYTALRNVRNPMLIGYEHDRHCTIKTSDHKWGSFKVPFVEHYCRKCINIKHGVSSVCAPISQHKEDGTQLH